MKGKRFCILLLIFDMELSDCEKQKVNYELGTGNSQGRYRR